MPTVTAASFLFVAALLAVFAVLIDRYEMYDLIAGYDSERVDDDEALAAFVSRNVYVLAGLTALVALLVFTETVGVTPASVAYSAVVVALTAYLVWGAQRYTVSG